MGKHNNWLKISNNHIQTGRNFESIAKIFTFKQKKPGNQPGFLIKTNLNQLTNFNYLQLQSKLF
jgi:hypothetical protein